MEEYQLAESIKKAKYCALMSNFNGFSDIILSMRVLESQNISADVLREAYDLAILLAEKRIYLEAMSILSWIVHNPNTTEEELSKAYSIATNEKYLSYMSGWLLAPIAKHPNAPRHILLELAVHSNNFVAAVAKKHPTLSSYWVFE